MRKKILCILGPLLLLNLIANTNVYAQGVAIPGVSPSMLSQFSTMSPAIRTCQLIANNSEGKSFNSKRSLTAKDIELGPSDEEIQTKFYSLTERVMKNKRAKLLFEASMDLENMAKISTLVDLTEV